MWQQVDKIRLSGDLDQNLSHLRAHHSHAIFVEFARRDATSMTLMADLPLNGLELLDEYSVESIQILG